MKVWNRSERRLAFTREPKIGWAAASTFQSHSREHLSC